MIQIFMTAMLLLGIATVSGINKTNNLLDNQNHILENILQQGKK